MTQIPFLSLKIETDRIVMLAVLSESLDDSSFLFQYYEDILHASGWTVKEYEEELLNHINTNWFSSLN